MSNIQLLTDLVSPFRTVSSLVPTSFARRTRAWYHAGEHQMKLSIWEDLTLYWHKGATGHDKSLRGNYRPRNLTFWRKLRWTATLFGTYLPNWAEGIIIFRHWTSTTTAYNSGPYNCHRLSNIADPQYKDTVGAEIMYPYNEIIIIRSITRVDNTLYTVPYSCWY